MVHRESPHVKTAPECGGPGARSTRLPLSLIVLPIQREIFDAERESVIADVPKHVEADFLLLIAPSACDALFDGPPDRLVVIPGAVSNEVVYAIKEGMVARGIGGNCTQAHSDLCRSDLSESGCGLFDPLRKVAVEETIDPLHIAENLCFRYQID